jgi:excisionase family DNA binding protein
MTDAPVLALTVAQASQSLNVSRSRLYELVASGELPSIRIGRSRRIPLTVLHDFIEGLLEDAERDGAGHHDGRRTMHNATPPPVSNEGRRGNYNVGKSDCSAATHAQEAPRRCPD